LRCRVSHIVSTIGLQMTVTLSALHAGHASGTHFYYRLNKSGAIGYILDMPLHKSEVAHMLTFPLQSPVTCLG
jgi:hypothetical protein